MDITFLLRRVLSRVPTLWRDVLPPASGSLFQVDAKVLTLLLYITVNTTTIEYNANETCFDIQQSSSG